MRLVLLSDLHGHLPPVPACDLVLLAGDVCPATDHEDRYQAQWLDTDFRAWLGEAGTPVIAIAGNHDFVFERQPELVPPLPWTYLLDAAAQHEGITLWGTPWQRWFHDWAFNAPKGDEAERFLAERFDAIPAGTDVLVAHSPPRGYGDLTAFGRPVGSRALMAAIERVEPALVVCGHIHEARGHWRHGPTLIVNACVVDYDYRVAGAPYMVDLTRDPDWHAEPAPDQPPVHDRGLSLLG